MKRQKNIFLYEFLCCLAHEKVQEKLRRQMKLLKQLPRDALENAVLCWFPQMFSILKF